MANCELRILGAVLLLTLLAGCCCPGNAGGERETPDDLDPDVQQVFISMTTVRIPEAHVQTVLGDLCPVSAAKLRLLSGAEHKRLQEAWQKDERVRVVQAPKILALDGQEATISVGETIRFAKTKATTKSGGLAFSIEEDGASPVFLGFQMRMTPRVAANGSTVNLDLEGIWREPKEQSTGEAILAMGPADYLSAGVYERTLRTRFDIPSDGHAIIGSPEVLEDADGRHVQVTLIHVRVLSDAQAGAVSTSNG